MDATGWILLTELGFFGGFAVGAWIADAIERARWRRVALAVFTRPPVASLTPPTMAELQAGEWIQRASIHSEESA